MALSSSSHALETIRPLLIRRLLKQASCVLLLGLAATGAAQATTYYVRTDGGSVTQCTGKSNAAYPGSGSNKACAWNSLHQALPASGSARINGGDTVYIAPGNYMLGWGAPGASGGRCYDGGRYDCYLPPIPSGPSANSRTRILGTSASNPARLWGTERVQYMLNLNGSSNVEIGNLEITDQSDCVEFHTDSSAKCRRDSTPYGQWAGVGIMASNSKNVYLHDLNIHGMANRGIVAGGLTDWTLERVKIVANGWAGWDGDIGSGSSNSGNIILKSVEIAWNGCGEKWQSGTPWACWAQTASGYGDGLGTARTGGNWLIEDSYIHHNTSDGLDLLYMDGASNSSVTVRRTHAVGNAGNQLKTLGKTLIENSVVIGNCAYFNNKDSMKSDDQCRALGNAISVGLVSGQDITIRHNTITGQGDCLILSEGGSSSSNLTIQNNALVGQVDWRSDLQGNRGELTCGHYAYNSGAKLTYSGNLFYNVKQGQCPSGSICSDPKLVATAIGGFDATPRSGSPLIDKAPYLSGISNDFYGNPRPSGSAADIGAIEVQVSSGHPPPSISKPLPPQVVQQGSGGSGQAVLADEGATEVDTAPPPAQDTSPAFSINGLVRAWALLDRFMSASFDRPWRAVETRPVSGRYSLGMELLALRPGWVIATAAYLKSALSTDAPESKETGKAVQVTTANQDVAKVSTARIVNATASPAPGTDQPASREAGGEFLPSRAHTKAETSSRSLESIANTQAR